MTSMDKNFSSKKEKNSMKRNVSVCHNDKVNTFTCNKTKKKYAFKIFSNINCAEILKYKTYEQREIFCRNKDYDKNN